MNGGTLTETVMPGTYSTTESALAGWDLTGLRERYEAFCSEFARHVSASLGDRDAFMVRTRLTHTFRAFAQLDPELPEELAALSGARTRAAEIFETLYTGLAAPSQRHFDAVTRR